MQAFRQDQRRTGLKPIHPGAHGHGSRFQRFVYVGKVKGNLYNGFHKIYIRWFRFSDLSKSPMTPRSFVRRYDQASSLASKDPASLRPTHTEQIASRHLLWPQLSCNTFKGRKSTLVEHKDRKSVV